MYRLTYFKARNVIGFMSGIGVKTFELDLDKLKDKDILVIFGDNASGKSTFLSLVHPWPYPADGRTKFIIDGKEGLLYREYASDDGSVIATKCVYTPKREKEGHNTKCFFELTRAGEDEPVELNPSGNITSYYSLLYTYFGINKEFLQFATYNNAVSGIIEMTDQERKNSIGSMVPNMGRFEIAYTTVNDKYKELRSLIRNVSQKILQYRDEDSIRADLKRIDKEISVYSDQRADRLKRLGKLEGRIKELSHGEDIDTMLNRFDGYERKIEDLEDHNKSIVRKLLKLYDELGIEPTDGIKFKGMDTISDRILKYEWKLTKASAELSHHRESMNKYIQEKSRIENKIMELESTLYGVETQSLDELEKLKDDYESELKDLDYDPSMDSLLKDMTYEEAISFSNVLAYLHTMIQALYDENGDIVSSYFHDIMDESYVEKQVDSIHTLQARIETNSTKKDAIYRRLIELEQYRKFQDILSQRPKACMIDSCPFIANALKWSAMSDEVEQLKKTFDELNITISNDNTNIDEYEQRIAMYNSAQSLIGYLRTYEPMIRKYCGIELPDVYESIVQCNWTEVLNIVNLKIITGRIAARDRYLELTQKLIPDIMQMITMAKLYETSQDAIKLQIKHLKDDKKALKENYSIVDMHVTATEEIVEQWEDKVKLWTKVSELLEDYNETLKTLLTLTEEYDRNKSTVEQIRELKEKKKRVKFELSEIEEMIKDRGPVYQQLKLDLLTIDQLNIEKASIEQDFLVIDVIRMILQPGKGIRKELINIYLFDIYQTANQLLLNTFNGNLYLKEFIITDKEFIIPYVYNGTLGPDISLASSSQKAAISISISMAILSKIMGNYGIACFDEADGPFSPTNRAVFIDILTTQSRYIGLQQCFFITQHPTEYTESDSVGFIAFPGGNTKHISKDDLIKID